MDSKAVLVVAASGRALAASARRGGFLPLVVDYFGDSDTLALAHAHARLDDGLARGMTADALDAAFAALTAGCEPRGVVCGTGFEDRPELLAHIARRWKLFGNSAETVARLKDPLAFASLCEDLAIPHPATALARPGDASGWLAKRRGGAGGSHIRSRGRTQRRRHLLPAACRGRAHRAAIPRRWATRAHSRQQRAMVRIDVASAVSLRRRGSTGRVDGYRRARRMCAAHRCRDAPVRTEQRGFSCRGGWIPVIGDQPTTERDARHLRAAGRIALRFAHVGMRRHA